MQILNFSGKKNQMVSVLQEGHPFKYILVEHAGRWMTVDGVIPMDGKQPASCVTHLVFGEKGEPHGKIEIQDGWKIPARGGIEVWATGSHDDWEIRLWLLGEGEEMASL